MTHKVFVSFGMNEGKETLRESLKEWQECFISYMGDGFGDGMVMQVTEEQEQAIRERGFSVREDISE